jgi:L-fuconolactonase
VDVAIDAFGADRLMFGSDWPVCLMAGDYDRVCSETVRALASLSATETNAVLGGTAVGVYRLEL